MMTTPIEVLQHNPYWLRTFQREAEDLADILGVEMIITHHIGSTAIPGVDARPIIDLIVEVRDINQIARYDTRLAEFGYALVGEQGIPGRRFYIKNNAYGNRTHNLYIFQNEHPAIQSCLDFRDYLLTHPNEALFYSLLKKELAKNFGLDLVGYMQGKDEFIQEVLQKAQAWRQLPPD